MNAKDAAAAAAVHLRELMGGEKLANLGLEEIDFNYEDNAWMVTFGFTRDWDVPDFPEFVKRQEKAIREFKTVMISDLDGSLRGLHPRKYNG